MMKQGFTAAVDFEASAAVELQRNVPKTPAIVEPRGDFGA
jgi:hypothetical protein